MNIKNDITELIGGTPLLYASRFARSVGITDGYLIAKLECMNPTGSSKDRAALYMLKDAEANGLIREGGTVIEPTSGNTGIAVAAIAKERGYNAVIVMPDTMSPERRALMEAYGARVVLTDGRLGMRGSIEEAEKIKNNTNNSFILGQFTNSANLLAHYETTGPEIFADTDGDFDVFIAAIGTGGTISGIGRFLKEKNPNIEVIGVEPCESPLITEGIAAPHKIEGIGANFIPDILDMSVIDRVVTASEKEAFDCARRFSDTEGVLVGISSGAALAAATRLLIDESYSGKKIVTLLPDSGNRYLSTKLFK